MPPACNCLEDVGSKKLRIIEGLLVPTPAFSGQVDFKRPDAISFASTDAVHASPNTGGTLMAGFSVEPGVLRGCCDTFPAENFVELVITWPGFEEWTASMADIVKDGDQVTRAELARFVAQKFSTFAEVMGLTPCSRPEWRLGNALYAYNTKNTSLAFLWSPAPGVWQPAFRPLGIIPYDIKGESSPS